MEDYINEYAYLVMALLIVLCFMAGILIIKKLADIVIFWNQKKDFFIRLIKKYEKESNK